MIRQRLTRPLRHKAAAAEISPPDDAAAPDATELEQAYSDAYETSCQDIFDRSPNGQLFYSGQSYNESDCSDLLDASQADQYGSTEEAAAAATTDAVSNIFDESPSGSLCYGRRCFSPDDYDSVPSYSIYDNSTTNDGSDPSAPDPNDPTSSDPAADCDPTTDTC